MTSKPKVIFVSHPLRGGDGVEVNRQKITDIMRTLRETGESNAIYLSPIHALSYLDATDESEDDYARRVALDMVDLCDEVHAFGQWRESFGCDAEIRRALSQGKLVLAEWDGGEMVEVKWDGGNGGVVE